MTLRVHPADYLRIPVTFVIVLFSARTGQDITLSIAAGHSLFSILWLVLQMSRVIDQDRTPALAFAPAALDIAAESLLVLVTGVFSPYIIGYAAMTAVSSLNTRVRQGEFVTAASIVVFGFLIFSHSAGVTRPFELLHGGEEVGFTLAAATWCFFSLVIYATYRTVNGLTRTNERIVAGLKRAEHRMRNELDMARQIQAHLLPGQPPQLNRAKIHYEYIALSEVGGDYLDFLVNREKNLTGILVADAAGHGVPAALVATMARIALDSLHSSMDNPVELIRRLNAALLGKTNQTFLTGLYAVFDSNSRTLRYAVAGGPPPFLLRRGRPAHQLPGRGSLIAILENMRLEERSVELESGDAVVLVTDGILECRDPAGRELKEEQVTTLLSGIAGTDPASLAPRLISELRQFMGSRGFEDDVTLVVISVD